jgi:hypothetical protein
MDDQQSAAWFEVGQHAVRREPAEETLSIRLQGDLSGEDAWNLAHQMRLFLHDGERRLFLLLDASALGNIPPTTRKAIVDAVHDVPIAAGAVFGASFAQRVIATLTDRTSKLLRRGQPYETRFFATEEQARAWIAQKRA